MSALAVSEVTLIPQSPPEAVVLTVSEVLIVPSAFNPTNVAPFEAFLILWSADLEVVLDEISA